jgi:hypothetical protein
LAYGFFEYITNKPEANLLIVGLDGAGKTVSGSNVSEIESSVSSRLQ